MFRLLLLPPLLFSLLFLPIWAQTLSIFDKDEDGIPDIFVADVPLIVEKNGRILKIKGEDENENEDEDEDKGEKNFTISHSVYVPVSNGDDENPNWPYSTIENAQTILQPQDATSVQFKIHVDNSLEHTPTFLQAAIYNGSNFLKILSEESAADREVVVPLEVTLTISLSSIIAQALSTDAYTPSKRENKYTVLIYVGAEQGEGEVASPATDSSHIALELNFSDGIKTLGLDDHLTLENLEKGVSRLTLHMTEETSIASLAPHLRHQILVVHAEEEEEEEEGASHPTIQDIYAQNDGFKAKALLHETPLPLEGPFFIGDLANGREYCLGILIETKHQFASQISNVLCQTPESIEAFLESQDCYLLSAGFKREHYVIRYFQDFRDRHLLRYPWGRALAQWYAQSAPQYALLISHNDILSAFVRALGYLLFFLMNASIPIPPLALALFILGAEIYLHRRNASS